MVATNASTPAAIEEIERSMQWGLFPGTATPAVMPPLEEVNGNGASQKQLASDSEEEGDKSYAK